MRNLFRRAQHLIDSVRLDAFAPGAPDGFDVVNVDGRVYLRAVADNRVVMTLRMDSAGLLHMAANLHVLGLKLQDDERRTHHA